MRVLYFIESLGSGGKERRLVELIYALVTDKVIECEVVIMRNEIHYSKIKDLNIKIHVLERRTKKDPSIFFKFYQIAKKFNPDIINVWGNMVVTYAIPTKLLLNKPLINNQITDAPLQNKKNINLWFNFYFSDRIVSNTQIALVKYGVKLNKSQVIYNGFDFSRICDLENPNVVRKRFNIQEGAVIGMVAGFSIYKDYFTFIKAAIKVLERNSTLTFLCIGSGNYQLYLDMVPSKFKKSILFLGPQQNVESIMNLCDIGVLTSYGEGISNALMEFMALGKPVIATNLGGTPELVKDGYNGCLIGMSDEKCLIEKLDFLINNEDIRIEIGKNNKKTIQEKFSMNTMKDSFVGLYKSFMK